MALTVKLTPKGGGSPVNIPSPYFFAALSRGGCNPVSDTIVIQNVQYTLSTVDFTGLAGGYPDKLVYVDDVNGDDTTGGKYDPSTPYKTIAAAEADSVSGDMIYVYNGAYTETGLGTVDGVNYYFEPQAIVTSTTTIFDLSGGNNINIYGRAIFNSTGGGGTIGMKFGNGCACYVEADSMTASSQAVEVDGGANVRIFLYGADGMSGVGNGMIVQETVIGDGSYGYLKAHKVVSTAICVATVAPSSDTCLFEVDVDTVIQSKGNAADAVPVYCVGGKLKVRCAYAEKTQIGGTGTAAIAISGAAGDNARLVFYGDTVVPKNGVNVLFAGGLGMVYGNSNGGRPDLGGGTVKITGGLVHEIHGAIICDTATPSVNVTGGKLKHFGVLNNTNPGGAGYLFSVTKALILAGNNSIHNANAAGASIDDGGGTLTALVYGAAVGNTNAAGTVVIGGGGTFTQNADVI